MQNILRHDTLFCNYVENRMKIDYFSRKDLINNPPNCWDYIGIVGLFALFFNFAWFVHSLFESVNFTEQMQTIDMNPMLLPIYAFKSLTRMLIAMLISLTLTFSIGTFAAKNKVAEKIIVPLVDILQSIPIYGFITAAILMLITLFPERLLALEIAVIFGIFTSQVWNILLSFYQSIKTLPKHYSDTSAIFQLSPWKRFWIIEVPHALPGLISNIMVSMSAGWFYVVVSEAITVSRTEIFVPGLGSYMKYAIDNGDIFSLLLATSALFLTILVYDQIIFRPLQLWQEKLTHTDNESTTRSSWFINYLHKTFWIKRGWPTLKRVILDLFPSHQLRQNHYRKTRSVQYERWVKVLGWLSEIAIMTSITAATILWVTPSLNIHEVTLTLKLGLVTSCRVFAIVILSLVIWVPIGIWVGNRPRLSELCQPIIQFLAAYPPNGVYPFVAVVILQNDLNANIWLSPLMILGAQWYIAFNVIAGVQVLPTDLKAAIASLNLSTFSYYKRFVIPGILPYITTGAIAAAGGAWNVCVVTESISWSNQVVSAEGLGAYIKTATANGDYEKIALGICVMCCYVLFYNRIIWQPLYQWIEDKYSM